MRGFQGPVSPHPHAENGISVAGELLSWDQTETTPLLRNIETKRKSENATGHIQTAMKDMH